MEPGGATLDSLSFPSPRWMCAQRKSFENEPREGHVTFVGLTAVQCVAPAPTSVMVVPGASSKTQSVPWADILTSFVSPAAPVNTTILLRELCGLDVDRTGSCRRREDRRTDERKRRQEPQLHPDRKETSHVADARRLPSPLESGGIPTFCAAVALIRGCSQAPSGSGSRALRRRARGSLRRS